MPATLTKPRRLDRGDWMQTYTGKQVFPLDPRADDICIHDIAHALSNLCRFAGHCRSFYSVAQHSVIVSELLPAPLRLAGLLHDATEAFIVDIPRPLKIALPDYKRIEHRWHGVIAEKFGVDFSDPRIKRADNIALMTEARDLLGEKPAGWGVPEAPANFTIKPQNPDLARHAFMHAFRTITSQ